MLSLGNHDRRTNLRMTNDADASNAFSSQQPARQETDSQQEAKCPPLTLSGAMIDS
jgi:hypothetical protein